MSSKLKMGRIIRRENKDRRFGSATHYNFVRVENESGQDEEMLAFTDNEIEVARERMEANAEDLQKPGFLRDLLD